MAKVNPDEIYHKAQVGRLRDLNDPAKPNDDESRIVSANVEGSDEYEREQQQWREDKATCLTDKLPTRIMFFVIVIFVLIFTNRLYGTFLPIVKYALYAVAGLFVLYLISYVIRQIKISHDSKQYKKQQKNKPTPPVQ